MIKIEFPEIMSDDDYKVKKFVISIFTAHLNYSTHTRFEPYFLNEYGCLFAESNLFNGDIPTMTPFMLSDDNLAESIKSWADHEQARSNTNFDIVIFLNNMIKPKIFSAWVPNVEDFRAKVLAKLSEVPPNISDY